MSRWFSVERANLFSFRRKDHGTRLAEPLRPWADTHFQHAGVDLRGGAIRLVTFPRHVFYKFAPISLWLGYSPEGGLAGILYEVNNTFGETHVYTAAIPDPNKAAHTADKVLHVSPFFDVSGQYRFAIRVTPEHLKLTVASHGEAGQSHVATIMVKAVPVTDAALLRLAVTQPFASLGVTFGIHWQALRLLLKGAKYHEKPVQKQPRISTASQTKRIPE